MHQETSHSRRVWSADHDEPDNAEASTTRGHTSSATIQPAERRCAAPPRCRPHPERLHARRLLWQTAVPRRGAAGSRGGRRTRRERTPIHAATVRARRTSRRRVTELPRQLRSAKTSSKLQSLAQWRAGETARAQAVRRPGRSPHARKVRPGLRLRARSASEAENGDRAGRSRSFLSPAARQRQRRCARDCAGAEAGRRRSRSPQTLRAGEEDAPTRRRAVGQVMRLPAVNGLAYVVCGRCLATTGNQSSNEPLTFALTKRSPGSPRPRPCGGVRSNRSSGDHRHRRRCLDYDNDGWLEPSSSRHDPGRIPERQGADGSLSQQARRHVRGRTAAPAAVSGWGQGAAPDYDNGRVGTTAGQFVGTNGCRNRRTVPFAETTKPGGPRTTACAAGRVCLLD